MKMIGSFLDEDSARGFSDTLLKQRIYNDIEPNEGVWEIWVHDEDQSEKAKREYDHFPEIRDLKRLRDAQRTSTLKEEEKIKNR